jgi:hypothetical protein
MKPVRHRVAFDKLGTGKDMIGLMITFVAISLRCDCIRKILAMTGEVNEDSAKV